MNIPNPTCPVEQHRMQVGPVTIAYQVAGTGTPLVLIHGLSGSCRWWEHNLTKLAEHYRVYVVDLVGFGDSRGTHPFVLLEAAGYLAAWLDQLGIVQAAVVGHSMGGFIAADLAADYPEKVSELVLVDAAMLHFEHNYLRRILDPFRLMQCVPPRFLPILFSDAQRAGPVTLAKAAYELLTTDIRPKLSRIHTPTLVVWGDRDTLVPLDYGRHICHHLPGVCEMVILKGAGHNPMWDTPEAFNRVLLNFLQTQSTRWHTACTTHASISMKAG